MEHNIPENDKVFHKMVVQSSAQTYMPFRAQGLEVTVNPLVSDKRWVGGENNQIYPDIVLWRPNPIAPNTGTAIAVEQIETARSLNLNIENWRRLASIQNVSFVLVVPVGMLSIVQGLLTTQNIHPFKLQTYEYNSAQNNFMFRDIT